MDQKHGPKHTQDLRPSNHHCLVVVDAAPVTLLCWIFGDKNSGTLPWDLQIGDGKYIARWCIHFNWNILVNTRIFSRIGLKINIFVPNHLDWQYTCSYFLASIFHEHFPKAIFNVNASSFSFLTSSGCLQYICWSLSKIHSMAHPHPWHYWHVSKSCTANPCFSLPTWFPQTYLVVWTELTFSSLSQWTLK